MRNGWKRYIPPALAVFAALALLIRPDDVRRVLSGIFGAAFPFGAGVMIAAVTDPAVSRFERFFGRAIKKPSAVRGCSIAAVYLLIAGVISAAAVIIIPRLWSSASLFVSSIDGYYSNFRARSEKAADMDSLGIISIIDGALGEISKQLPKLFDRTYEVTAGFIRKTASFLVGAVLSVYILAEKRRLTEFISGAARAAMSEEKYSRTAHIICTVNSCLVSFIGGQLAEAAVLGTLCFIGMVIFGFDYPLLISTIIGVTALVPVAGAFVGAVPSALMLFLVKPSSALWFIVFIIVLQQLENNFIYPKVVGKSVGLPPILILAAIIVGAELWGAAGIMLGIPLTSAAYTLIREKIEENRLAA